MTKRVVIVDYGRGNLFSVARAVEVCGGTPVFSEAAEEISSADRVILPGVGAFGDAMQGLRDRNLIEPLIRFAAMGRPLLGICLGMQMLLEESFEHGSHAGLGLIGGVVERLPQDPATQRPKVPAVGWRPLQQSPGVQWDGTVLANTQSGDHAYFVHSYAARPSDPSHLLATYKFGAFDAAAVIARENVTGCQFHPEKSAAVGLGIIDVWMK